MSMENALRLLGVTDHLLSDEEKTHLDARGFLPLEGVLSEGQVRTLRRRFDELVESEGGKAGAEVHQEEGTHRLANLVDKGEMFEVCISHPKVLAGVRHVLGTEFRLSSLNGRAALPGLGLQALHADWREGVEPGGLLCVQLNLAAEQFHRKEWCDPGGAGLKSKQTASKRCVERSQSTSSGRAYPDRKGRYGGRL